MIYSLTPIKRLILVAIPNAAISVECTTSLLQLSGVHVQLKLITRKKELLHLQPAPIKSSPRLGIKLEEYETLGQKEIPTEMLELSF